MLARLPGARWLLAEPALVRSLGSLRAALVDGDAADPPYPRRPRLAPAQAPGAPRCPIAAWREGYAPLAVAVYAPGDLGARQAAQAIASRLGQPIRAGDVARSPSAYSGDPLAPPAQNGPRPWRVILYFDRLPVRPGR